MLVSNHGLCAQSVKSFIRALKKEVYALCVLVVGRCVILHKSPESSRTATEECAAYGFAVPSVLTGIWHARCHFNFTAPPSETSAATAHKACWGGKKNMKHLS